MDPFSRLVDQLTRFPGVGSRQAKRFVYYLLSQDRTMLEQLSRTLLELKGSMSQCSQCFRFFNAEHVPDVDLCSICAGRATDKTIMMIVEKEVDVENVVKSGSFFGRYFVLGGLIPLVQKRYTQKIRTDEFVTEVKRAIREDGLKEIIFGLTVSPEGDHTKEEIVQKIREIVEQNGLKVTSLGRGLSTGTELEYSDDDTLKNALRNRF